MELLVGRDDIMAKAQAPSDANRGEGRAPASYELSAALRIEVARQSLEAGTPDGGFASRRDQAARERDELAAQRDRDGEARERAALEPLDADAEALRSGITLVCEGAAADRGRAREDREQ